MTTRVAAVCAYDPSTGWSTQPLAVVGWRPGWTFWEWIPCRQRARELRYLVIDDLSHPERDQWLQRFFDDPTPVYSVDEILALDDTTSTAEVEQVVRDTIDELLAAGI